MTVKGLNNAISAAIFFLIKAEELKKGVSEDKNYLNGTKLSGSFLRISMDLTRALAEMRKP